MGIKKTGLNVVLSVGLLLTGCLEQTDSSDAQTEQKVPARPAKIVAAVSSQQEARREFPATIEASKHSNLAFRVSGQLQKLPVQAGDQVKKGQMLAQLDQADYRNALADRQARYDLAKTQFDQIKALIAKKYASKTRLDEARAGLKAASAALSSARDNLSYTTLKAPFDGVVARVDVDNFQPVQAQSTVIRLQDAGGELEVQFSVPESLVSRWNTQAKISSLCGMVRLDSLPGQGFKACYKKHDSVPDNVTRTYRVVFAMPNKEGLPILPGMSVNLDLNLDGFLRHQPDQNLVSLPLEAVFDRSGRQYVWQVNDQMQAVLKEVTPVRVVGSQILLEGLEAGEQIIAAGVDFVQAGQSVYPLKKERGL